MAILTVEAFGFDRCIAGITAIQKAAQDLRPFWKDVFAPAFFADVQDRFAVQGRTRNARGQFQAGTAWAPLNPSYKAWKERHFPGKPILQRTGRLKESLTWNGTGPGPDGLWEATETFAVAGTKVPYGPHHMKGGKNLPARPFMAAPNAGKWAAELRDWLMAQQTKGR